MDARRPCPDSALLAAFLDGMLTGYERSAVVTHLAECPVCRKVALTVIEFQEEAAHDAEWHPAPPPAGEPGVVETREKRWSSEKTRAPAVAIGFAVLLTVVAVPLFYVLYRPPLRPPVETLASAAAGQRPIFARVSGGFAFAPPPREPAMSLPERSPLILAANRVRRDYAEDFAAPSRRAFGVASLLSGDANAAVASLSIAALAAPNDAQVANDLAAAYYERAGRLGYAEDLAPALDAAERAVRMQPDLLEAWFNRALIITALGLRIEARSAWQEYLRRDASSSWANEARNYEQQLANADPAEAWLGLEKIFERDNAVETASAMVAEHPSKARELFEKLQSEWTDAARAGVDEPQVRARMRALGEAFWHVQRERFYKDIAMSVDGAATEPRRQALAEAHLALGQARAVPFQRAGVCAQDVRLARGLCCARSTVRWRCARRWKRSRGVLRTPLRRGRCETAGAWSRGPRARLPSHRHARVMDSGTRRVLAQRPGRCPAGVRGDARRIAIARRPRSVRDRQRAARQSS